MLYSGLTGVFRGTDCPDNSPVKQEKGNDKGISLRIFYKRFRFWEELKFSYEE